MFQDPVLWVWLEIFFSSKRYQYFYSTLFPVIFVWLRALKGIAKALAMDLLMLNPLGVIKTRILAPKRCDEPPPPSFLYGTSLGPIIRHLEACWSHGE